MKAIAVTGQIAVSRDLGRGPGRPHGTRVSKYPGINIPSWFTLSLHQLIGLILRFANKQFLLF